MDQSWTQNNKFWGNSSFRFFFTLDSFFFFWWFSVRHRYFCDDFPPFFLVVLEYCGYYRSQKIQNISDGFQEIHRFDFLTRVFFFLVVLEYYNYHRSQNILNISGSFSGNSPFRFLKTLVVCIFSGSNSKDGI